YMKIIRGHELARYGTLLTKRASEGSTSLFDGGIGSFNKVTNELNREPLCFDHPCSKSFVSIRRAQQHHALQCLRERRCVILSKVVSPGSRLLPVHRQVRQDHRYAECPCLLDCSAPTLEQRGIQQGTTSAQ